MVRLYVPCTFRQIHINFDSTPRAIEPLLCLRRSQYHAQMRVRAPLHQLVQRLVQMLLGLGHVLYGGRVQGALPVLPKVVEQTLVLERVLAGRCFRPRHKQTNFAITTFDFVRETVVAEPYRRQRHDFDRATTISFPRNCSPQSFAPPLLRYFYEIESNPVGYTVRVVINVLEIPYGIGVVFFFARTINNRFICLNVCRTRNTKKVPRRSVLSAAILKITTDRLRAFENAQR